jgi:Na+/phosphate symporter
MNWIHFPTYAYISGALWLIGLILVYLGIKNKTLNLIGTILFGLGILVIASFYRPTLGSS